MVNISLKYINKMNLNDPKSTAFFQYGRIWMKQACKYLNIKAFTLIELLIVIAIISLLSALGIPNYIKYKQRALIVSALAEIRIIDRAICAYETDTGNLPTSLSEINSEIIDPWGNPYQYLNIRDSDTKGKGKDGGGGNPKDGKPRKDRFLVPVNSDYDLYSMGADGESVAPFTAKPSRDDIVRANNGLFYGLVSDF